MDNQNIEIITSNRSAHLENHKGLSEAVIVEIVHSIKEIIIEIINRRYKTTA